MIRLGYIILNKAQIFRDSLIAWNNKNENAKTWFNFQSHFRKAYRDLKKVRALTIQNSTIANATIVNEIKKHNTQTMQNITDSLKCSIYETVNLMSSDQEPDNLTANAVTVQSLQNEIRELKDIIAQLAKAQAPQQSRKKKQPRKYCWTHGWCAHSSMDCKSKAEGHKDEATVENKMGGSTKNCVTNWLKENGFKLTTRDFNNKPITINKKLLFFRTFLSQLAKPTQSFLKADTGASATFIKESHKQYTSRT